MLLTRKEMTFDFGGARLDPVRDRHILRWMVNQFLYGEVTGVQIGHWLYHAPDLESARFLARQAVEELQHVDNFLRIMAMLGLEPAPANSVVRFLATGMMGGSWPEHVAMEMAAGEGLVLMAFYAVIDTLDHPPAVAILRRAVRQEERHVEFGERQTMKLISARPELKRELLGLSLVWRFGIKRLAKLMDARLPRDHPVLESLYPFLELTLACHELRLRRIGLLDRPLTEVSRWEEVRWVAEAYARKGARGALGVLAAPLRPLRRPRRLTDTYLQDPTLREAFSAAVESERHAAN